MRVSNDWLRSYIAKLLIVLVALLTAAGAEYVRAHARSRIRAGRFVRTGDNQDAPRLLNATRLTSKRRVLLDRVDTFGSHTSVAVRTAGGFPYPSLASSSAPLLASHNSRSVVHSPFRPSRAPPSDTHASLTI